MRAIILAAGQGNRARGKTKALMMIEGQTIIGRLIDQLERVRVRPVVVVGHCANVIMDHLGSGPVYIYNPRYANTGPAESLFLAANALHPEKDFIVILGDTVFDMLTVASVVCSPDTAALTPYDGKGRKFYTLNGRIVVPSMSTSISGFAWWSWAGIARMEVSLGLLNKDESAGVPLAADLNVIHGRSVNVNTLADLEDARRFCA